jgi:signal transduction histidine kinase
MVGISWFLSGDTIDCHSSDVLNVSKLTAGLISLVKAEFHAHSEVYNVIRMFRDEVSARGLQLQLEKDESWDRMAVDFVSGDSGRFTQVIVNLLSFAILSLNFITTNTDLYAEMQ